MNRQQRRAAIAQQHEYITHFPVKLTQVPPDQIPDLQHKPDLAWFSREYMVQLWHEPSAVYPDLIRLSVCRVRLKADGKGWQDNLTWEELQAIKHEVGYGDWYGVEVYPPDAAVVNVANFRHLWLMSKPLTIGWLKP